MLTVNFNIKNMNDIRVQTKEVLLFGLFVSMLVRVDDNFVRHFANESTYIIRISRTASQNDKSDSDVTYDVTLVEIDVQNDVWNLLICDIIDRQGRNNERTSLLCANVWTGKDNIMHEIISNRVCGIWLGIGEGANVIISK